MRWDDVREVFEEDRRFSLRSKDAKRKFDDFLEDLRDEIYDNFKAFLDETPLLHKDRATEGEEFDHLLEKLSVIHFFFEFG